MARNCVAKEHATPQTVSVPCCNFHQCAREIRSVLPLLIAVGFVIMHLLAASQELSFVTVAKDGSSCIHVFFKNLS